MHPQTDLRELCDLNEKQPKWSKKYTRGFYFSLHSHVPNSYIWMSPAVNYRCDTGKNKCEHRRDKKCEVWRRRRGFGEDTEGRLILHLCPGSSAVRRCGYFMRLITQQAYPGVHRGGWGCPSKLCRPSPQPPLQSGQRCCTGSSGQCI